MTGAHAWLQQLRHDSRRPASWQFSAAGLRAGSELVGIGEGCMFLSGGRVLDVASGLCALCDNVA